MPDKESLREILHKVGDEVGGTLGDAGGFGWDRARGLGDAASRLWENAKPVPGRIAHSAFYDFLKPSANWLYRVGRGGAHEVNIPIINLKRRRVEDLKIRYGHTSWGPVFYDNGESRRVQEAMGSLQVSIPLFLNGKAYPATLTHWYLKEGDKKFPQLLLQLRDPLKAVEGDETLELVPTMAALEAVGGRSEAKWRVWMNDRDIVAKATGTLGNPEIYNKEAAELTIDDITTALRNMMFDSSGGTLDVSPDHLYLAMMMLCDKAPVLKRRLLEFPMEHFVFQKHLLANPDVVATFYHKILVRSPRAEFLPFVTKIREGKISTWSQFKRGADEMAGYDSIGEGPAILPELVNSGFEMLPDSGNVSRMEPIPPSLILSFFGLKLINTYMDLYEKRLIPKMAELASGIVDGQEARLQNMVTVLKIDYDAQKALEKRLIEQGSKVLIPEGEKQADRIIELKRQQMQRDYSPKALASAAKEAEKVNGGEQKRIQLGGDGN